ncbi:MAG: hypothetical protein LBK91_04765 [Synergistaceae bacterium]|jgi:hypothetical protein|nr:hypothetical protein [Synergistaceae bacterium]
MRGGIWGYIALAAVFFVVYLYNTRHTNKRFEKLTDLYLSSHNMTDIINGKLTDDKNGKEPSEEKQPPKELMASTELAKIKHQLLFSKKRIGYVTELLTGFNINQHDISLFLRELYFLRYFLIEYLAKKYIGDNNLQNKSYDAFKTLILENKDDEFARTVSVRAETYHENISGVTGDSNIRYIPGNTISTVFWKTSDRFLPDGARQIDIGTEVEFIFLEEHEDILKGLKFYCARILPLYYSVVPPKNTPI